MNSKSSTVSMYLDNEYVILFPIKKLFLWVILAVEGIESTDKNEVPI